MSQIFLDTITSTSTVADTINIAKLAAKSDAPAALGADICTSTSYSCVFTAAVLCFTAQTLQLANWD